MILPVSQGFGYWGLMSTCGTTKTDAAGAHVNSPASWTTRGKDHPTAHLLDLVPGRSGTVHENWLAKRGQDFRAGVQIATLDPFQGYKNAIDDQLQDATSVRGGFHIVKLAGAPGEVRRRVQQDTLGHRGRTGPLPTHSGHADFVEREASVTAQWQTPFLGLADSAHHAVRNETTHKLTTHLSEFA